jgi:hypothetical protein
MAKALEIPETEVALVILPAFYYGAASSSVKPPGGEATVHVHAKHLQLIASENRLRASERPRSLP